MSLNGKRYATILADPPWSFKTYSDKGEGRSASQHYRTMAFAEIAALPVADWAQSNCALFLWATDPMLPKALELIERWGFVYKTVGFCWTKTNASGDYFVGMGYWSRANSELCLLATRGKPERLNADVRRLIVAPRREHSRKPDEVRQSIEQLVPGPYLEMFARESRPGWDSWGDQTTKFDRVEAE